MKKLVSIDLKSNFGFFRKPDANAGINLSYNMLHKPAILGILGAIIGLEGYTEKDKIPQYYTELQSVKIGIEPFQHEKGNFAKTVIKYSNTVGYANKGSNYLTEEATLIAPAYRCYVLLDMENVHHHKLYEYLKTGQAEFLPYFGKNEFYAWWESYNNGFREYEFEENKKPENSFQIKTLFCKKNEVVKDNKESSAFMFDLFNPDKGLDSFLYFERLPLGFNDLFQYELGDFAFTTFNIRKSANFENLYHIKTENYYVQLL